MGEAAGGAVIHVRACSAAGTANFIILGFGNWPYDFVIDAPAKEVLCVR